MCDANRTIPYLSKFWWNRVLDHHPAAAHPEQMHQNVGNFVADSCCVAWIEASNSLLDELREAPMLPASDQRIQAGPAATVTWT